MCSIYHMSLWETTQHMFKRFAALWTVVLYSITSTVSGLTISPYYFSESS